MQVEKVATKKTAPKKKQQPLTKIEYSLQVGDYIEYTPYFSKETMRATITEIGDPFYKDDEEPCIETSLSLYQFTHHKPYYRIISSNSKDAPPIGK